MTPTLVGDGVENPHNARAMLRAAGMFGCACRFRDRAGLASALPGLDTVDLDGLRAYDPLVAIDNLDGAREVYGQRLPTGPAAAVVVGNERTGVARDVREAARLALSIPMAARGVNTLNVACAAAVALFYLTRETGGRKERTDPNRRRPELLLVGPQDAVEAGSSIRSACAFGWSRVLVEDRARVWFHCDRAVRSEGRGAARRGRNPIRVVPVPPGRRCAFEEVRVALRSGDGEPLTRADLARGAGQVIAIPDESAVDPAQEDWQRLGRRVRFARLDLPAAGEAKGTYRLVTAIVLAEIARQIGRPPRAPRRVHRLGPCYDHALRLATEQGGELLHLEDLLEY